MRKFLKAFGPATIGSAGVQIAMFADTIIASFLPSGSVSYLYYADRLYQLPLAVIGIAIGVVLLPALSRRVAAGDEEGARRGLNRALEGIVVLTLPCVVVFLLAAEPVMAVLFGRGAFDANAVAGSARALEAYAIGLTAVVALRALTPAFHARGDTATPVKVLAVSITINVASEDRADGSPRECRPRARDVGRRLDQRYPPCDPACEARDVRADQRLFRVLLLIDRRLLRDGGRPRRA